MEKNILINVAAVLLIFAAATVGIYFYAKSTSGSPVSKDSADLKPSVSVDATGGSLSVSEIPVTGAASGTPEKGKKSNSPSENKTMPQATINTNFGRIVLELYAKDAPKTVENFVTLAKSGFYNGLTFHRVIAGFMIQGGDPKGDGTGGPGYTFADELNPATPSYQTGYKKGVLAMANAGPNTNGSQFFIMLADTPLPHDYTIFGRVVSGQETVDKIGLVQTGANDRPLSPAIMKSVEISE